MRRSTAVSQACGSTVVQLGGLDQREHRGGTFATPIGAGE